MKKSKPKVFVTQTDPDGLKLNGIAELTGSEV